MNHEVERYPGELAKLRAQVIEAEKVIGMVQDNTKMPHHHTDPQTRLYCLAERAKEFMGKFEVKNG
jgi:hypothetical protein